MPKKFVSLEDFEAYIAAYAEYALEEQGEEDCEVTPLKFWQDIEQTALECGIKGATPFYAAVVAADCLRYMSEDGCSSQFIEDFLALFVGK